MIEVLRRKPQGRTFDSFPVEVFRAVVARYPVGELVAVHTVVVEGDRVVLLGEKSETSRKFVLETTTGRYFLKEVPWYCDDAESIAFSAELANRLADAGLPFPSVLPADDGRAWVDVAGSSFTVSSYRPGGLYDGSEVHRRAVGDCLGRMHTAMRDLPVRPPRHESIRAVVAQHRELVAQVRPDQAGPGTGLAALVDDLVAELPDDPGAQPIHGDFIPWNLAHATDGGIRAVYDLDNACGGNPLRDLGKAVATYHLLPYAGTTTVLRRLSDVAPPVSCGAGPLVEAYQRRRPLTAAEAAVLPAYVVAGFAGSALLSVVRGEQAGVADGDFRRWLDAVRVVAEHVTA